MRTEGLKPLRILIALKGQQAGFYHNTHTHTHTLIHSQNLHTQSGNKSQMSSMAKIFILWKFSRYNHYHCSHHHVYCDDYHGGYMYIIMKLAFGEVQGTRALATDSQLQTVTSFVALSFIYPRFPFPIISYFPQFPKFPEFPWFLFPLIIIIIIRISLVLYSLVLLLLLLILLLMLLLLLVLALVLVPVVLLLYLTLTN